MAVSDINIDPQLTHLSAAELAARLRVADFLGREHFLAFGEVILEPPSISSARACFATLFTRHVFPADRRKPDFESMGLEFALRENVGLGKIPEYAAYHLSSGDTKKLERYAVSSRSLVALTRRFNGTRHNPLLGMGIVSKGFLLNLAEVLGPNT